MPSTTRTAGRTVWVAIRAMALLTVLLGLIYPLAITAVGALALPAQAGGSLLRTADGTVVGSSLIGQSFSDAAGAPLARYFQPRPSAAGDGYNATSSAGSNLGPQNPELVAAISERRAQLAAFDGVPESRVPADAVTASSSGLDPHISAAYAAIQVQRVATARGLPVDEVRALVQRSSRGPDLGYLGETRVNVLELNLALDELKG
ncbi:MAG: potassium-transporting ATPase subunit KdpC [Actinobacteria bacterium]|nr:potassium-transporting ATPase subunit KdpC [Actinomycetota bacterium]